MVIAKCMEKGDSRNREKDRSIQDGNEKAM